MSNFEWVPVLVWLVAVPAISFGACWLMARH
jgi:hypothetical protein